MNSIIYWIDPELVQALGWTLLHSLWQGGAIALLLAFSLIGMRKLSALARYWVALSSLLLLMVATVLTFSMIYEPELEAIALAETNSIDVLQQQEAPKVDFDLSAQAELSAANHPTVFIDYFENHLPLLVMAWLMGVLLLCLRMLGEIAYIQHLKHYRCQPAESFWRDKLAVMSAQLNIRRKVQIRETFRVHAPMVVGVFKPVILFPIGLLANMPVGQVESILAHELAHIRRHDYLINLFQALVEILLFFNPAMWWISAKIKAERENSCDDLAIQMTGDTMAFVKSLARLEEWRLQGHGLAMSFTGQKQGVLGRVQRLLNGEDKRQIPAKAFWSLSVVGICLSLLLFQATPVESQNKADQVVVTDSAEASLTLDARSEEEAMAEPGAMDETMEQETNSSVAVEANEADFWKEIPFQNVSRDSVPQDMAKLEMEMQKLQKEMHQRMQEVEQKMHELESQELVKQRALQVAMQEKQKQLMELELNIQKQENERNLLERSFDISGSDLEMENLHLDQARRQLDQKRAQLDESSESLSGDALKAQLQEIQNAQRALMEKEKALKMRRFEAEKKMKAEMIQREKALQELQNSQSLMQQEVEMMERDHELAMLQFEQQRENLSVDEQLLERNLEARHEELESKLGKLMEEMEKRENQEE